MRQRPYAVSSTKVDVTLLRWLALCPDEHLEVEAGEDLDHMRLAIADPASQPERLFEAVKHNFAVKKLWVRRLVHP
jgi:hypothetical protein